MDLDNAREELIGIFERTLNDEGVYLDIEASNWARQVISAQLEASASTVMVIGGPPRLDVTVKESHRSEVIANGRTLAQLARRQGVSGEINGFVLQGIIGGLCPGFFPFC